MRINIAGAWVGNAGIYTVSTQYVPSIYTAVVYTVSVQCRVWRQQPPSVVSRPPGGRLHTPIQCPVAVVAMMGIHIMSVRLTSLLH